MLLLFFSLNPIEFFHLFLFLLFVFSFNCCFTSSRIIMLLTIHKFNIIFTCYAFVSLWATFLIMIFPISYVNCFFTKMTSLRFHFTDLTMLTIFEFRSRKSAVLTNYWLMFSSFMFFLFSLSNTLIAFFTFIVLSWASDIVHSEFWCFD